MLQFSKSTGKSRLLAIPRLADDLLSSVTSYSGYKLQIGLHIPLESWQPYRVKSICEYDGTAKGGELSFTYANNQTTVTDVVNGTKEILQFNNFGNLLCVQDSEGRAVYAQYANSNSLNENNPNKASAKAFLQAAKLCGQSSDEQQL